jgi:hypothetical protein
MYLKGGISVPEAREIFNEIPQPSAGIWNLFSSDSNNVVRKKWIFFSIISYHTVVLYTEQYFYPDAIFKPDTAACHMQLFR